MPHDPLAAQRQPPPAHEDVSNMSTPLTDAAPAPDAALAERHQHAPRHIHTLETHNAQLYQDNCQLLNAVNTLNDRLAFFGASQSTQVLLLTEMQEKLRTSEVNRGLLNRKYQELLHSISAGSAQHVLAVELQAIRNAYASLEKEHRILGDKYVRLKAALGASHVAQQHVQRTEDSARGLNPLARPESAGGTQLRTHDQNRMNSALPTSAMSLGSFHTSLEQHPDHPRQSSEGVVAWRPPRQAPTPIATTWLAPLPSPPLSAFSPGGQISPTGFPVHAPMPAGSLPLPHHGLSAHTQTIRDPRTLAAPPTLTQSRHPVEQRAAQLPKTAVILGQCHDENADETNDEPALYGAQIEPPALPKPSPHSSKRPISELQASPYPEGKRKKLRMERKALTQTEQSMTLGADTNPASMIISPLASTDPENDHKPAASGSYVRSYEDCVNLIFEKDADVENGVFCGLCLDRYEAKMIPEPPDVVVRPDFDLLVEHCKTMHPAVWDDLHRHKT